jgi:hypothetical protein
MQQLTRQMERLGVLLAIGFAFGWLGPFGTYNSLGLLERLAFWMVGMAVIGLLSVPAVDMVARAAPSWPVPVRALAGALIVGIPGVLVTVALRSFFHDAPPVSPADLPRMYLYVTIVSALVGIPMNLVRERRSEATGARPLAPPVPAVTERSWAPLSRSPFLRRIPPKLGSDLLYIATEDHYLRVTTSLGSDLILFRLSDAIAELGAAAGQQVHRSYWVARDAVASIERNGHRTSLVLIDGAEIPVSRTYLRNLRDAGWLALPPSPPLARFTARPPAGSALRE